MHPLLPTPEADGTHGLTVVHHHRLAHRREGYKCGVQEWGQLALGPLLHLTPDPPPQAFPPSFFPSVTLSL